ncbi:MAG: ArsC family reductase [Gammaproteobacteria bacterium]|nr:ArsC family reductase [Gammaproteobacteria bacterium]
MTILYGIKNCDTVRKARKWLETHNIEYTFHDVRSDGLDEKQLRAWVKSVGWELLLNRRGTTWRQLPDKDKETIDEANAIQLMLAQPSLINRPVLVHKKITHVGFKPTEYQTLF